MIIFIKSFNRPYYLERCINSILLNIDALDLEIIILDDGTQPKYLTKIKEKFPAVQIKLSPFHNDKAQQIQRFINDGTLIGNLEIPTEFWLSSIKENNEDYFILLEDDMWFTEPIDLKSVVELMQVHKMCLLKMFYFGNERLKSGQLTKVSERINTIKPKVIIEHPYLFKNIIVRNKLKVLSIAQRLGFYNPNSKIDYYTIYNVAGAIFSKDYYEYLWKGFKGKVYEDAQLIKAVEFHYKHKDRLTYGIYDTDVVKTSFSSSATNMFADVNLNVFTYNHLLNEAWYEDRFNVMAGYPLDIAGDEIIRILQDGNKETASPEEWEKWSSRFKGHFEALGHTIL